VQSNGEGVQGGTGPATGRCTPSGTERRGADRLGLKKGENDVGDKSDSGERATSGGLGPAPGLEERPTVERSGNIKGSGLHGQSSQEEMVPAPDLGENSMNCRVKTCDCGYAVEKTRKGGETFPSEILIIWGMVRKKDATEGDTGRLLTRLGVRRKKPIMGPAVATKCTMAKSRKLIESPRKKTKGGTKQY